MADKWDELVKADTEISTATRPLAADWTRYHSDEEHDTVGPPEFLISNVLQREAIMGIGAFVRHKKTLLALNIACSLCSGEPLFGRFEVVKKPTRVLYLGPENGMISFAHRVNLIGLREYLNKTFFYVTMGKTKPVLQDLSREEIQGAAIFIDTAIRYTEGDESSSAHMKAFSEMAFSLIRDGAECVIILFHSTKLHSDELSLENCFRGSGELTAFLSVAIGIRTQDLNNEYESASLVKFVKLRDFELHPSSFEVVTDKTTCLMSFVEGSHGAVLKVGTTANRDNKEEAAMAILRANPGMAIRDVVLKLKEAGITRGKSWVGDKLYEMRQKKAYRKRRSAGKRVRVR
jgi:hypothetical protein